MKPRGASVRLSLAGVMAAAGFGVGPVGLVDLTPSRAFAQITPEWCAARGYTYVPVGGTNVTPTCHPPPSGGEAAPIVDPNNCASVHAAIAWDDRQIAANSTNVGMRQSFIDSESALLRLVTICGRPGSGAADSGIPAGGFGNGYVPITGARGTAQRSNQITNNLLTSDNMALGVLAGEAANEEAEREQEQQAADAQAQDDQAIHDAQEALKQAQAAADDANRRAGLANPFAGQQQPVSPDNPFATPAETSGGQPEQVATADPNPFAAPTPADGAPTAQAPTAPTSNPPDRKLGDPNQADSLAPITMSACQAMIPRADIIDLPNGADYCVVEVDSPEPTNEWHHLVADPPPAPAGTYHDKTKSAASGVRG